MINPLSELSAVYNQNIAEGCGCDEKKKEGKMVKPEMIPQGKNSPMGGDEAKPGKDKNYVKPMGEGYDKPDEKLKTGRKMFSISQKERDAAKERLLAKAKAKREAMKEGHCEEEGVECSPEEKKKDSKKMMKKESSIYSNWREGWEFLGEISVGGGTYSGVDGEQNLQNPKAKTDTKADKKIEEKEVKNKIKINPPMGMAEAFAEIGGEIVEMYEIDEKIDLKKADMGEVIKDFRKSDAPQFKGKTKEKKRQMAIAAKLEADEEGGMMGEETEEEKKKREMLARTKEHDDKRDGKLAESDFPKDAPSIKDAKPRKKTNVKYDPHMKVMAPTIKEKALAGVISTIRSKNGMGQISSKGKDKIQDKKEKSMCEAAPLVALPAAVAKGVAIAGKVASGAAKAGAKAAKVAGKAGAKVGKSVSKMTPATSNSDDKIDLSGVTDKAGKVAKKVIDTGVNMVKNPLAQSVQKLKTNEELSIDQQMKIARDAAKNRNPKPDHKAIRAKMLKKPLPKDNRSDAQKMTDAVGKPRMGSSD